MSSHPSMPMIDIGVRRQSRRLHTTLTDTCAQLRLVQLSGTGAGRKHVIRGGEVLGRGDEVDITLDDSRVSREHARLDCDDRGRFYVVDLHSRNGTAVNGIAVQRKRIRPGDRIQLGSEVVVLVTRFDPSEQALLQQQRLEVLGRLGASLAHDLKNMHAVVHAGIDYVLSAPPGSPVDEPDIRDCLQDVRTAGARAAELIGRLLSFTRNDDQEYAPVDVVQICRETARLATVACGSRIKVETNIVCSSAYVRGSAIELHQVLMNICMNARDAMPDGGQFTMTVDVNDTEVQVALADTGQGMDAATVRHAFEPFFTTKRGGAGCGLGLATVRDIVVAHGGQVSVNSTLGVGTTFWIRLPRVASPERHRSMTRAAMAAVRPGALVLLVSGDQFLRRSLRRVLTRAGHEVVSASHGVEAIDCFNSLREQREVRPDLLLVDAELAKMSCADVIEILKERCPELCALVLGPSAPGADAAMPKPIGAAQMLAKVSELLENRACFDDDEEVAISDRKTYDCLPPAR